MEEEKGRDMEKGMLYGVGVGPGDPELVTLKASRIIRESDELLIPASSREECRAYRIAREALPEIGDKPCLCLDFPMTRNEEERTAGLKRICGEIAEALGDGRKLAFLTIGDPSVYSTFGYLAGEARKQGIGVRIVSGITSFTEAAGLLLSPLCAGDEELHIIPSESDYQKALALPGTKVFMKAGKKLAKLKEELALLPAGSFAVETVCDCGMETQRICRGLEEMPEEGYMAVVIVRPVTVTVIEAKI